MGKFLRSVLIGVGVGLLIAPKRGTEMRQTLMDRFQQLRGSFAGNSSTAVSGRSSETAQGLKSVAETAEPDTQMYVPPSVTDYKPAYPEYVNPNSETGSNA